MVRSILVGAVMMVCVLWCARPAPALEGHEALLKEEGWKEDEEYIQQDQRNIEPSGVASSQRRKKAYVPPRAVPKSAYKKKTSSRTGASTGGAKKVHHGKKRSKSKNK
jgi:hypothetical protein